MKKRILSIDIGLHHFAYVAATVHLDHIWRISEVNSMRLLNLTQFECDRSKCTLEHERCMSDYLSHLFDEHQVFRESDVILVELQPPTGFIAIQEIIRFQYRNKVQVISPTVVHKWFHFRDYPVGADKEMRYQLRKTWSIHLAQSTLREYCKQDLLDTSGLKTERLHDIADAFNQLWYHLNMLNEKHIAGMSRYFRQVKP